MKESEISRIIDETILKALGTGKFYTCQAQKDAYKMTERRLYAYPVLKDRLDDESVTLKRLVDEGVPDIILHSADIVRFQRSGRRLSDEELYDAQLLDLKSRIASKEHEIREIDGALGQVKSDYYYRAVTLKYFNAVHDDEVADLLKCDPSTARRNRARLVRRMAVWLYGPEAI